MANVSLVSNAYPGYDQVHEKIAGLKHYMSRYFDGTAYTYLAANTYDIFKIPKNAIVTGIKILVITAEGAATTLDVGDSGSVTRYETDADLNATGVTASWDGAQIYSADDTIRMQPSADVDAAKFYVIVEYILHE